MVSEYKFEGIIPINRESIFEEESYPPTESTYVDYEQYIKTVGNVLDPTITVLLHAYRDLHFITFLIAKFGLKYFLTAPVNLYNGKVFPAVSRKTKDYKDIINIFVEAEKENKNVFLYDLIYFPSHPSFYTLDKNTFSPIILKEPVMSESYWLFRYAVLEK